MMSMSGVTSVSSVGWIVRSASSRVPPTATRAPFAVASSNSFLMRAKFWLVDDLGDALLLDGAVVPVEVLPHPGAELLDQGVLLLLLDEY